MHAQPLLKSRVCRFVAASGMTDTRKRRQSRRFLVSGMVQGVGSESALAQLRAELERGPQGAFVSSVSEEEAPLLEQFSKRFSIEH
jgi:acylphosphatase